jgi:protein-S-isoprenylcysteine O-methyltransferase Ste14
MPFRATDLEFARRFWIITLVYCIGFGLSVVDHTNAGVWLIGQLVPSVDLAGAGGTSWLKVVFAGGAALVFLGAMLRTWAAAYLLTEVVHDSRRHSDELVADGPFRYVRNPLYLATFLMSAGVGLLASPLGWLFIVVLNGLFVHRLILAEEETLLARAPPARAGSRPTASLGAGLRGRGLPVAAGVVHARLRRHARAGGRPRRVRHELRGASSRRTTAGPPGPPRARDRRALTRGAARCASE